MKMKQISPLLITLLGALNLFVSGSAARQQTPHPYAASKPLSEARLFGEGVVSTPEDDLNAAFTPDGQTVYFTRNFPQNRLGVILFSRYKNGKWQEPELASFSGQFTDYDPIISPDGAKLFYCSNRGEDGKRKNDFDIWYVEKTASGWSAPKNVGAPVNTASNEFYPSVATDGTLYFSSNRAGGKGGFDVYRAKWSAGTYSAAENLGDGVNTQTNELDNYVAPDQRFLVFAAYNRADDVGGGSGDLYISLQQNGAWGTAKNLGPKINSPTREYCPIGSPDGKYFFFTSFRSALDNPLEKPFKNYQELKSVLNSVMNGRGNVYQIDLSALGVQ